MMTLLSKCKSLSLFNVYVRARWSVSSHRVPSHWWHEAARKCTVTPVSPLPLSCCSPSVPLCLIRLLSMQNNLPDGPVLSPELLTSPKAMEPSWAELCPVSRCQMSDGMDDRDSFAKAEARLELVVLAKTLIFFFF